MTNATAPVTAKNSTAKLSAWGRGGETLQQNAQNIIIFGLHSYAEHGDTGYLTRTAQMALSKRGVNADRMIKYIKAHANVTFGKTLVFKKSGPKSEKPSVIIPNDENDTWFNFEKKRPESDGPKRYDATGALNRVVTNIKDDERITSMDVPAMRQLVKELNALISAHVEPQSA